MAKSQDTVSGWCAYATALAGSRSSRGFGPTTSIPTACIARKAYAYSRGENSEDVPASAFKNAYKSFTDSGFRMRALLKAMVEDKDYFNAPAPETGNAPTKLAAQ